MEFLIKQRDGPARYGMLKNIKTPNIFFINTERFKAPSFSDITISNQGKKDDLIVPDSFKEQFKNDSYFIVTNAYQLFLNPKKFVDYIVELRQKIGEEKPIYLPSIGDPTNFSILSYLGVDLFDSAQAIIAARNSNLFFTNGCQNKNDLDELPCSCPICNKHKGKTSDMSFKQILNHNYHIFSDEIKNVRNSIKNNSLRDLVETRIKTNPNLISILRNLDQKHYNFLESKTPVTGKKELIITSKESLLRPEIKRFQERVLNRYRKPNSAKILLLLPCSAKKPYSFSKTHKFFRDQLLNSYNPYVVHELIVTSPIGIVPRELELVYPASMYDISVTGVWDEDEKKMIRNQLEKYLEINKYDMIISHLEEALLEFIRDILGEYKSTCIKKPTSKESLKKLRKTLDDTSKSYEKILNETRRLEDIQGLAYYQFDKKPAAKLLKNTIIKGKYPYQKIIENKKQLGMVVKERGFISLTLEGAEKIFDKKNYYVKISDDFELKGSVFAPGVIDADKQIRIGDEVLISRKNSLAGVGIAMMSGEEMKESNYGEAVKTRHHI